MAKQAMPSSRMVFLPTPNPLPPRPLPSSPPSTLPQPLPSPPLPSLSPLPPPHGHTLHSVDSSISLSLPSSHHPATVSSSISTPHLHHSHVDHTSTAATPPHSSKDPSLRHSSAFRDHNDHQSQLPPPQPHRHNHRRHPSTPQTRATKRPDGAQSTDQIEARNDPFTSSRHKRRHPSRLRQRAHREAERQRQIRARRQAYIDSSEDDQPVAPHRHKPTTKSLSYVSRFFHRLCHFPCVQPSSAGKPSLSRYHSGSHSSVYLPRLTVAQPSSRQPPRSTAASRPKPRRRNNQDSLPSRARDKGKHRAGSLPAVLAEADRPLTLSSLSLATTHSWCPYCVKATPGEGVAALQTHNHNNHRHLTTYLTSHSRNPSLDFTSSIYSDSLRTYSLREDDLTSLSDVETALPDTLFTYSHPLPHLAPPRSTAKPPQQVISLCSTPPQLEITSASPSAPSPPRSTSNRGLQSRPLSYPPATKIASTITVTLASKPTLNTNKPLPALPKADRKVWWKGRQSPGATTEESAQPHSQRHKTFLKGLERTPWFSSSSSKSTPPIHLPTEEAPSRVSTGKKTDFDKSASKRSSWSFFLTNRRASWFQSEAVDPSRPTTTKRQTEKSRRSSVKNTDQDRNQDNEQRFSFLAIEEKREQQEEEARLARVLTPILDQKATTTKMLATQQEPFMTHHPHTHHPHHILAPSGRQLGFSANSILMDQMTALEKLGARKSVDRMRAASDVSPHSRPQILAQVQSRTQGQISTQAPSAPSSTPQVKQQRRRSFLPSALMTSNLAKFVSGHSNSPAPASPTPAQSPRSPQSPISQNMPSKPEDKHGQILTMEQFKWSIGCCCHEIKTKVSRQRSLSRDQQSRTSIARTTPSPQQSPPTSKKHEWTKPRRYTITAPPPPRDDSKDAQPVLQALLRVMAMTQESVQDLGSSSRLSDSFYGQSSPQSSQMRVPQQSLSRDQSLHSFMGSSSSSNVLPPLVPEPPSSPLRQYHTYEISVSGARRPHMESQRFSWTPSARSLASQINSPVESLDRSSSQHLSSTASSSESNPYPGCEAILSPMTVQDLVRLLSFILSIAPEQWIPWHLYDFFVRPQGRSYRDLVDLLPTQSQRVLRTILATVDLLVDFAVASEKQEISPAPSSTSVSSSGKVPGTHLRSKSDASEFPREAMAVSESSSFGSMAMRVIEQSSNSADPGKRDTFGRAISTTTSAGIGSRDEILSQKIQAIRVLKRKAIIDNLSNHVFRSRQDVAAQLYGSSSSSNRPTSIIQRRSSMPVAPRANPMAPAAQGSEQERESASLAFENLVSAYEDEYYPQRSRTSMTTHPAQSTASGISDDSESRVPGPGLMNLQSLSSTIHRSGSVSAPASRHTRTPTSVISPILESDGSSSGRSLSLPPWRKQLPLMATQTAATTTATTESRRPKLASSVSSPAPTSEDVQRKGMVGSRSTSALGRLGEEIATQMSISQLELQPQSIQIAPLRLLILEEEEIVIKDTSDEESLSEGEGEDQDEFDRDEPLGQRSSLAALDGSVDAQRGDKVRDEELRDLLAQGLSLLKYKRKRRLKKMSSTFGDMAGYDHASEGGGASGGPSPGPSQPQGAEQDVEDDADVSGNEM